MSRNIFVRSSAVVIKTAALLCLILAAAVVLLRYNKYEVLSVQSDSMRPMMQAGDAILLNHADSDPNTGDEVSYADPTNPKVTITHRVIGVDAHRGIITTKGDNTPLVDSPVPAWNVYGTVRRVMPHVGYALNAFKHPIGLIAVVYLPAIGIVVDEIRRLSAYYRTGKAAVRPVHYSLRPHSR